MFPVVKHVVLFGHILLEYMHVGHIEAFLVPDVGTCVVPWVRFQALIYLRALFGSSNQS